MADSKVVLTIRVPEAVHDRLRAQSFYLGRSINEIALKGILRQLETDAPEVTRAITAQSKVDLAAAIKQLGE
jgi:hypothetical protein